MTTNPASSADTLSMSQQQMLLTVQNLQDMQKDLMHQFTSTSNPDERKKIANEMDKNEAVRANLLLSIGSANVVSNQVVATKTDELQLKKTLLQLANDELNATRNAMEEIQRTRAEKERMIGINTYFGKRFSAQAGVMKIFIYMCIPVLFLAILANMGFLPNYIAGFLIIASIVIGLIYIYNAISDINRRDDMNFDEYRWEFDPSRVGTIHHPHRHNKKKKDSSDADCKCDVQGDKSAVKGTSHKAGKSATSVANTAAPASGLLGDLSKPTAIATAPTSGPTSGPTSNLCWSYSNRSLKGQCMGDWLYNDAVDTCNAPAGSVASQTPACRSYKVSDMNAATVTPDVFTSFVNTCKVNDLPNCT